MARTTSSQIAAQVTLLSLLLISKPVLAFDVIDDFNDGVLDPAWQVSYSAASGWTYEETGTGLYVSDIDPVYIDYGGGAPWAEVYLSRDCPPMNGFHASLHLAWDSHGEATAMQQVFLVVLDQNGGAIARAGFCDSWVYHSGSQWAEIGSTRWLSGYGTMALSGEAEVAVDRVNDLLSISWNGLPLLEATSTTPVRGIRIEFGHYAYDGSAGTSFFGTESVQSLAVQGDVSPSSVDAEPEASPLRAHPNPFTLVTSLELVAPLERPVTPWIADAAGRRVATLADLSQRPGGTVTWNGTGSNGRRVAPGVYFVVLDLPSGHIREKLVRLK